MSPVSRRNLLGRAAAGVPLAAGTLAATFKAATAFSVGAGGPPDIVAGSHPDAVLLDPHPAWLEEYFALREWCNGDEAPENLDDDVPQWARSCELEDLIADTPAHTLAGVLAQVRLAQAHDGGSVGDANLLTAIDNAVEALERITGGAS
jgi:hypothetical protein